MKTFILNQIKLFKKKYYTRDLINQYINNNRFLIIEIKDNKINLKYVFNISNDSEKRKENYINMINKTLEKYIIKDTIIIIYLADGYSYDNNPVFNNALPDGYNGLIIPHYYSMNIDKQRNKFKSYKPTCIYNDIYFIGSNTTNKRNKIREKLENEKHPFNINVSSEIFEDPYKLKNHKYLIDLPGLKPWSVRLILLTLTKRLFIRISFYDSNRNEKSYWKQYVDLIYKENKDYIHLIYNLNYDITITNDLYQKIKKDILKVYNYYENNIDKYKKIVKNMKKKSKKITIDYTIKYIAKLLNSYTTNIIILNH
jgi:hypothetical protein